MSISALVSRSATYYKRHGFRETAQRVILAFRRAVFFSRQVVFYCDLGNCASPPETVPSFLKLERKKGYNDLSAEDLREMVSFWNPTLAQRNIEERVGKGASLWLIKSGERLAGYGWTLQGRTIAPYYFPLGPYDVHLFDFYVFPQYRGRGINPVLVNHILGNLAADCQSRAFIEAAEWNEAQLASLAKTSFRRLGWVRKLTVFGRTIVWWDECQGEGLKDGQRDKRDQPIAVSQPERVGVLDKR